MFVENHACATCPEGFWNEGNTTKTSCIPVHCFELHTKVQGRVCVPCEEGRGNDVVPHSLATCEVEITTTLPPTTTSTTTTSTTTTSTTTTSATTTSRPTKPSLCPKKKHHKALRILRGKDPEMVGNKKLGHGQLRQ